MTKGAIERQDGQKRLTTVASDAEVLAAIDNLLALNEGMNVRAIRKERGQIEFWIMKPEHPTTLGKAPDDTGP